MKLMLKVKVITLALSLVAATAFAGAEMALVEKIATNTKASQASVEAALLNAIKANASTFAKGAENEGSLAAAIQNAKVLSDLKGTDIEARTARLLMNNKSVSASVAKTLNVSAEQVERAAIVRSLTTASLVSAKEVADPNNNVGTLSKIVNTIKDEAAKKELQEIAAKFIAQVTNKFEGAEQQQVVALTIKATQAAANVYNKTGIIVPTLEGCNLESTSAMVNYMKLMIKTEQALKGNNLTDAISEAYAQIRSDLSVAERAQALEALKGKCHLIRDRKAA